MIRLFTCLLVLAFGPLVSAAEFNLQTFRPKANGRTDDTSAFRACFAAAARTGGTILIPAGNYFLAGESPIPLSSGLTVSAYGAHFILPESLPDRSRLILFAGENIQDFQWFGGHFSGHVFDSNRVENPWEPNANTRAILITTSSGGRTGNLLFRDVRSNDLAGAAITVLGAEKRGSEREIDTFARNITVENCTLERTGKFMWDYGLLWQITVWPEDYSPSERAMAAKYFRNDLIRSSVQMAAEDDRVFLSSPKPLPLSEARSDKDPRAKNAICFFGDVLPSNLVRGCQYFVIESTPEFIRIAQTPGGTPIRFASASGPRVQLITDLFQTGPALYAPTGTGPGKGALDLAGCQGVIVRGNRLSALGDTMHIQKSVDVNFANNQITGSRMGAFFLAEFCKNATITGNTVDGTNGSRVISVEKSCEDVTITGNTFRNGGRGSWINQPRNFILADNIFINNTTKCETDPHRGRRSFLTGEYERYAELYFTTYEPEGRYGNVIVRGNLFISGSFASHALSFAPGGENILVSENVFEGPIRSLSPTVGCSAVTIRNNPGLQE